MSHGEVKIAAAAILVVLLGGCASYGGPFVTNIRSDAKGNLHVEKCMVRMNTIFAVYGATWLDNSDCTTTTVRR